MDCILKPWRFILIPIVFSEKQTTIKLAKNHKQPIKMVLCNVTKRITGSSLFVDFSQCNITSGEANIMPNATNHTTPGTDHTTPGSNHTTPGTDDFDKEGAMTFIVAVILVYGLAVMGVIALGLLKKKRIWHVDRQAIEFVKHIEEVRRSIDQQSRVGAVSSLLKSLHHGGGMANGNASETVQKHLLSKFEMFALPMSPIREGTNDKDENNNICVKDGGLAMNAGIDWNVHKNVSKTHVQASKHVTSSVSRSFCTETEV